VSVPRFLFFLFFLLFIYYLNFLKKITNLPRVKLSSYHVAVIEWCGSDNVTCQYYARCHFFILNLVFVF